MQCTELAGSATMTRSKSKMGLGLGLGKLQLRQPAQRDGEDLFGGHVSFPLRRTHEVPTAGATAVELTRKDSRQRRLSDHHCKSYAFFRVLAVIVYESR